MLRIYKFASYFACFLMIAVATVSCRTLQLKSSGHAIPMAYDTTTANWTISGVEKSPHRVNADRFLNRAVVRLWTEPKLRRLLLKSHPFSKVKKRDIYTLDRFINRHLLIFYIHRRPGQTAAHLPQAPPSPSQIPCQALNNLELAFLLNNGTATPTMTPLLSMLMISTQELLLQQGARPVYHPVQSEYLLSRFFKKKPKKPVDLNLFDRLNDPNRNSQNEIDGFIFCRKTNSSLTPHNDGSS